MTGDVKFKKEIPPKGIEIWGQIRKTLLDIVGNHRDVTIIGDDSQFYLKINSKYHYYSEPSFYSIEAMQFIAGGKLNCNVVRSPYNQEQITPKNNVYASQVNIESSLQDWLTIIRLLDDANITEEEEFYRQNQEDIMQSWTLNDPNAHSKIFSSVEQKLVDDFLDDIIKRIELTSEIDKSSKEELIEHCRKVQKRLAYTSKADVVAEFSKIEAKAKKSGPKIGEKIIDAALKVLFNKLFEAGYAGITEHAPMLIEQIHQVFLK